MTEQEDPVEAYKKALAASAQQSSIDPVEQYRASLAAAQPTPKPVTGGLTPVPPAPKRGPIGNAIQSGAAHLLSAAQVVPGVEELEAGMGALGSHFPGQKTMSYAESLANLRANTDKINPYVKTAEQTVASIPMLGTSAIARLSPLAAGAMFGGLHGATKADPNLSVNDVLGNTAKGTAIGSLIGKGMETGGNIVRAWLSKDLGENAVQRAANRSSASAVNYPNAIESAGPPTPAVQAVINNQHFGPLAEKLEQSPSFEGVSRTDPRFLLEIYRGLSDEGLAVEKGLIPPDPRKGNSLRRQGEDVKTLKNQLLTALEAPGEKPPITFDVPSGTASTDPNIIPGYSRPTLTGPQTTYTAPPVSTAQSPHPTLRDAIADFHARPGIAVDRREGTVAQQMAREALERHSAENIASPTLRGSPPGERTSTSTAFTMPAVERQPQFISPGVDIQTPAMRVQTAPAEPMAPMMPDLRPAIEEHAQRSTLLDRMQQASDAADRAINKVKVKGKNLTKTSNAAFRRDINSMSPSEAAASQEGVLGRLDENLNFSANPFKLFGAGPAVVNTNRVSPFIRQLDQQSGNTLPDLLAKLGIVATTPR
jgi:hypothetical protein